jgi:hypothetical protein
VEAQPQKSIAQRPLSTEAKTLPLKTLLLAQSSNVRSNSLRLQTAKKQRPSQLLRISPDENKTSVNPEEYISVIFKSQGVNSIDQITLQLLVDGVDVTTQAKINPNYDTYNKAGIISFGTLQQFSLGKHTVEMRFADERDRKFAYAWNFSVSPGSPAETRQTKARKYQALFARYPDVNSSPEEVGQFALNHTYARVRALSGTPRVALSRRVTADELPKLGFGRFPGLDKERPLMLVIIDGNFDIQGLMRGGLGYRNSEQPLRYRSIAYVFDLCVGFPTITSASPKEKGFQQALTQPNSLPQPIKSVCRPPIRL